MIPIVALSLLSSCKDLREATLVSYGFCIWKVKSVSDQRRSERGLLVHHVDRGSQRKHFSWLPTPGIWPSSVKALENEWTHASQAHQKPKA